MTMHVPSVLFAAGASLCRCKQCLGTRHGLAGTFGHVCVVRFLVEPTDIIQVHSLATQNRYYKKSASFCLRAVARHSPELAQAVVACGSLEPLVTCLEEFDPGVKEGAAWALGYISSHNYELAQQVIDSSAVPLLVLCVQVSHPSANCSGVLHCACTDVCAAS